MSTKRKILTHTEVMASALAVEANATMYSPTELSELLKNAAYTIQQLTQHVRQLQDYNRYFARECINGDSKNLW